MGIYIFVCMYIYIYHGSIYVYIHQLEWDMLGSDGMFIRICIYIYTPYPQQHHTWVCPEMVTTRRCPTPQKTISTAFTFATWLVKSSKPNKAFEKQSAGKENHVELQKSRKSSKRNPELGQKDQEDGVFSHREYETHRRYRGCLAFTSRISCGCSSPPALRDLKPGFPKKTPQSVVLRFPTPPPWNDGFLLWLRFDRSQSHPRCRSRLTNVPALLCGGAPVWARIKSLGANSNSCWLHGRYISN